MTDTHSDQSDAPTGSFGRFLFAAAIVAIFLAVAAVGLIMSITHSRV